MFRELDLVATDPRYVPEPYNTLRYENRQIKYFNMTDNFEITYDQTVQTCCLAYVMSGKFAQT